MVYFIFRLLLDLLKCFTMNVLENYPSKFPLSIFSYKFTVISFQPQQAHLSIIPSAVNFVVHWEGCISGAFWLFNPFPLLLELWTKPRQLKLSSCTKRAWPCLLRAFQQKCNLNEVSRLEFCRIHWFRHRIIFYLFITNYMVCIIVCTGNRTMFDI